MKPLLFFLLTTLLTPATTPVQAQHPDEVQKITDTAWETDSQEDDLSEFVLNIIAPLGSDKRRLKGYAVLQLIAPLGSTNGSLTGDAVLQFTPLIGSNKDSVTEARMAQPTL